MAKKRRTVRDVDDAIARWMTRLRRAIRMVDDLHQEKKRIIKAAALAPRPAMPPVTMLAVAKPQVETDHLPEPEFEKLAKAGDNELEIPEWLRRAGPIGDKTPASLKDLEARAQIEAEQANKRIAKSRARIEKMKAKKAGDLKKMPLSGKAALDHIRNG